MKMVRSICAENFRANAGTPKTDQEVLGKDEMPSIRIRLATEKLLFARRMYSHGPEFFLLLWRWKMMLQPRTHGGQASGNRT